jgi:negative regulator of flagellin synthesis FlgM
MKITGNTGNIKHIQDDSKLKKGGGKENVGGKEFSKILAEKSTGTEKPAEKQPLATDRIAKSPVESVRISSETSQTALVEKAVKETPDVRTDKINEIKAKIASGNYNVSAGELADKMINSGFIGRLLRPLR